MSIISLFKSKLLFILFLIVLFLGLFVLNAIDNDTRIKHELWNTSHYLVFFVFWLFMTNLFSWLRPLNIKRILLILFFTFVVSAAIEWLQSKIGRIASWDDVKLSIAGGLGVVGVYIYDLTSKKIIAYVNIAIIVTSSIVLTWPSLKIFIDEIYIFVQMPVLSDFSTPFEKTRWQGSFSSLTLSNENNKKGLKVSFKPGHWFSTVELRNFYRDWTGFNKLIIEVDNLGDKDFNASVRVHDKLHQKSWYAFDDRFTKRFVLQPGLNVLEFKIEEIKNSPSNRSMDMTRIEAMMLIVREFEQIQYIVVNKVYLE